MATAGAQRKRRFVSASSLADAGQGKTIAVYRKCQSVFAQSDAADAIFYIQNGKVKLTVVSKNGKEAVVALLGAGEFFGEGCLAGQQVRMSTAAALSECIVVRLEKQARVLLLLANFGKEGKPETVIPKDQSGDAGRDCRHHPFPRQLLHESFSPARLYRLQRRATGTQFASKCYSARLI